MAAYVLFTLTALIPNRLLSTGLRLALMTTALAALLFADAILPIERCVYCFFLGTFIWKLPRRGRFNGTIAEIVAILASIISLLWTNQYLQFVVCPLIFSVTIYIFSCKKGYISRYFADSKSFIYLGDISYSIYMVHFLVAFSLYNSVKVILPKIGFRITTAPPDLVLINGSMIIMDVLTAMYLVMIVVLASLTYRFIEKPGIRIFGKWAKKYS
jgi:peptidoglycan/LPS O-acetylase OafA/YrhL